MPSSKRIIVVGSSNTDMVIKTESFPKPGETLMGGEFFLFPGGKGANQAVAAARLEGQVTLIAKIGKDLFGEKARAQFSNEGIVTDYIHVDEKHPSGVALITVDGKGENTIVVAAGSNGTLSPADVKKGAALFSTDTLVLMQLEIPLETVTYTAELAKSRGATVILNPAPARTLPGDLLSNVSIITPNRTEAETLSGIRVHDTPSATEAAKWFQKKGIATVIITLGKQGAFVSDNNGSRMIDAPEVQAVDSTAAGDIFNGALAVALSEGSTIDDAVRLANRAAALSVTRMGAQSSAPYKHELA
ncbi:ribokinase [Chryseolinea sp. T2]|uniref:ribokinase n=1 Tax=Chryseolinea sp. T2 TaxID=3129255 RepID=UPI0030771884